MNSIGVVYRIIEPYNRRRNQENGLSQWIGEIKCHYSINDYQIGKNDSVQRRDHCLRERHVRCNVRHRRERAKTNERDGEKNVSLIFHYLRMHGACVVRCVYLNLYSTLSSARIKCRWFYAVCLRLSFATGPEIGANNFPIDF